METLLPAVEWIVVPKPVQIIGAVSVNVVFWKLYKLKI